MMEQQNMERRISKMKKFIFAVAAFAVVSGMAGAATT